MHDGRPTDRPRPHRREPSNSILAHPSVGRGAHGTRCQVRYEASRTACRAGGDCRLDARCPGPLAPLRTNAQGVSPTRTGGPLARSRLCPSDAAAAATGSTYSNPDSFTVPRVNGAVCLRAGEGFFFPGGGGVCLACSPRPKKDFSRFFFLEFFNSFFSVKDSQSRLCFSCRLICHVPSLRSPSSSTNLFSIFANRGESTLRLFRLG